MTEFSTFEARISAENEALAALFDYAATPPQYAHDAAEFKQLTDRYKGWLDLAVPGIARLRPEIAATVYESRKHTPPHEITNMEHTGFQAYQVFTRRHDLFRDADFTTPDYEGTAPFLRLMPSKEGRLIEVSYMPAEYNQNYTAVIETEDSTPGGRRYTEGVTELYDDHVSFTLFNPELNRTLVLSGEHDEQFLDGFETRQAEVAKTLRSEPLVAALDEAGLYGLGSYLLWRSTRDLYEVTDLPQIAPG